MEVSAGGGEAVVHGRSEGVVEGCPLRLGKAHHQCLPPGLQRSKGRHGIATITRGVVILSHAQSPSGYLRGLWLLPGATVQLHTLIQLQHIFRLIFHVRLWNKHEHTYIFWNIGEGIITIFVFLYRPCTPHLLEQVSEGRDDRLLVWAEQHLVIVQHQVQPHPGPLPRLLLAPQPRQHALHTPDQHLLQL